MAVFLCPRIKRIFFGKGRKRVVVQDQFRHAGVLSMQIDWLGLGRRGTRVLALWGLNQLHQLLAKVMSFEQA